VSLRPDATWRLAAIAGLESNGIRFSLIESLCQAGDGLMFKGTKSEEPRQVELLPSLKAA